MQALLIRGLHGVSGICMNRDRSCKGLLWDAKWEVAVFALTPQQVNDAFKRHVDPSDLSIVKGGDFKKVGAYE